MAASFAPDRPRARRAGPALGIDSDSVRNFGAVLLIAFAVVMLVPALASASPS
jgi:cytochrome c-type biogenesis protein